MHEIIGSTKQWNLLDVEGCECPSDVRYMNILYFKFNLEKKIKSKHHPLKTLFYCSIIPLFLMVESCKNKLCTP